MQIKKTKREYPRDLWLQVRVEYEQGVTPKALSKKYDIPSRTISSKAWHDKWSKLGVHKRETEKRIVEKVHERIEAKTVERVKDSLQIIDYTKEIFRDYLRIERIHAKSEAALAQEVADKAIKEGVIPKNTKSIPRSAYILGTMVNNYTALIRLEREILGITPEDVTSTNESPLTGLVNVLAEKRAKKIADDFEKIKPPAS